jgi:hypothetical protein
MKTLLIIILSFLVTSVQSQTNQLQTEATSLDELIVFIANTVNSKADKTNQSHHYTFLVESPNETLSNSEKEILKQNFKILSHKLSKEDAISLAFYNSINGLLINQTKATQIKEILHAIDSGKLQTVYSEGISETYAKANSAIDNYTKNTLVFVKNSSAQELKLAIKTNNIAPSVVEHTKPKNNQTGTVVLLTAISLLPELINVIKD